MKYCLPGLMVLIIFGCSRVEQEHTDKNDSPRFSSIRDSIFVTPFGGYGYDIIVDGKVIIHQPHIPVIAWQSGFVSVEDAQRTAQRVISTMEQNQFPPQLTMTELKELGIVK